MMTINPVGALLSRIRVQPAQHPSSVLNNCPTCFQSDQSRRAFRAQHVENSALCAAHKLCFIEIMNSKMHSASSYLCVDALCVRYGEQFAVDDLSLTAGRGEFLTLL